jgi:hypothetical protein
MIHISRQGIRDANVSDRLFRVSKRQQIISDETNLQKESGLDLNLGARERKRNKGTRKGRQKIPKNA